MWRTVGKAEHKSDLQYFVVKDEKLIESILPSTKMPCLFIHSWQDKKNHSLCGESTTPEQILGIFQNLPKAPVVHISNFLSIFLHNVNNVLQKFMWSWNFLELVGDNDFIILFIDYTVLDGRSAEALKIFRKVADQLSEKIPFLVFNPCVFFLFYLPRNS